MNKRCFCNILTFEPGQKCHSKVMHRKEVTHSNGSYERKLRGQKLADEMGRAKIFPWYTHRLMHRKRVTTELHDSYFRLMTIKHSISKIEWVSNDYITELSLTASWVAASWRGDVVGKTTPGRRGLGPWLNWGPEENEKETMLPTITLGSKYFSYVWSLSPSHTQTLNNPFKPSQ